MEPSVAGITTVTESTTLVPLASDASVGHVTTPPAAVPPLVAETKITPAGSESRTITRYAADGPALLTVSAHLIVSETTAEPGPVFTTDTSTVPTITVLLDVRSCVEPT